MILEAIKYIRLQGKSKEWAIEGCNEDIVHFGNINLIVGKNAAGKSRTLAVIREISGLLSGTLLLSDTVYSSARYTLIFKDGKDKYTYLLNYENRQVTEESIYLNNEIKVDRTNNLIYSELTHAMEPFVISKNLIANSLHDAKGYPYLDKLLQWGLTLKIAEFTNQFEKNLLVKDISQIEKSKTSSKTNPISLLQTFLTGKQLFGKEYVNKVREDMHTLNYSLETIDIMESSKGYSIYVKEDELEDLTSQQEMSQGMFRVLSFAIQLNFALMSNMSVCVLVDDLGEGLDFDRSKILIDLLIKKIRDSNIQIFMTSNDRYIMNKIPLEYWSVIKRHPKKAIFYNYFNSKKIFDDFKYTGLSNFDFLATDFYYKGFDSIEE